MDEDKKRSDDMIDYLFSTDPNRKPPKKSFPTLHAEHVDGEPEYHEELRQWLKQVKIAHASIREKHPVGKEFVEGTMDCPICKTGTRWYMISDHDNGHIHSNCTTKGCVNWME